MFTKWRRRNAERRTPPVLGPDEENRQAYLKARSEADASGQMVCGTYDATTGAPVYLVLPRETAGDVLAKAMFTARYGRPPTEGDEILADMAQRAGVLG